MFATANGNKSEWQWFMVSVENGWKSRVLVCFGKNENAERWLVESWGLSSSTWKCG